MKRRIRIVASDKVITAAEDDEILDDFDGVGIDEALDDVADTVEDIQDDLDDVQEDAPDIETDNNIEGHFIAECEHCHQLFISAMQESEQIVQSVRGVCPLCGRDGEQYLKWVIVDAKQRQTETA